MLQETEKRNRDFAARMREQREDLKKMTESHLEELTKRTILENEQMSAELQYESRQVQVTCLCLRACASRLVPQCLCLHQSGLQCNACAFIDSASDAVLGTADCTP